MQNSNIPSLPSYHSCEPGDPAVDATTEYGAVDGTGPDERYTIAYSMETGFLLACVPDGEDVHRAIERRFKKAPVPVPDPLEVMVVEKLMLTDDENLGEIMYAMSPHDRVWLEDAKGEQYVYAVASPNPSA
jgi:hypothetical protein